MEKIIITFLTEKGEIAYKKVEEEGDKESFINKRISKKVAVDKIVNKKPLVVEINIKIKWLAVKIDLRNGISESLSKFGAVEDTDFIIREV